MARHPRWSSRGWARAVLLALSLVAVAAHDAPADSRQAAHDLQTSDDFRVRVSAALTLGRSHALGALALLEHALGDAHPAVRTAAAAGLAALGDRTAVPYLQQRVTTERAVAVRSEIIATIAALTGGAAPDAAGDTTEARWQAARYVVAIGDMHNRSGVQGEHASDVLRTATRSHARDIPGAFISDASDAGLLQQAASRHLPVLMLDGALQRLAMGQKNTELSYNAQVDYSMRRVPEQQLRGILSGSATSFGTVNALSDPNVVTMLEDQAIEGAVESALRGAARGFGDALR